MSRSSFENNVLLFSTYSITVRTKGVASPLSETPEVIVFIIQEGIPGTVSLAS
jgi:hypothetical protein